MPASGASRTCLLFEPEILPIAQPRFVRHPPTDPQNAPTSEWQGAQGFVGLFEPMLGALAFQQAQRVGARGLVDCGPKAGVLAVDLAHAAFLQLAQAHHLRTKFELSTPQSASTPNALYPSRRTRSAGSWGSPCRKWSVCNARHRSHSQVSARPLNRRPQA